jgi:hypothetical protein
MEDPGLIGNKYAEGQLPYLKANPSDGKVQFSFRGRIARLGAKQEGGKPKSGEIPSWAQYTLVVQEHYATKMVCLWRYWRLNSGWRRRNELED